MAGEKTEKATPKRREEARKKGQVPKSHDLNGAVIMLVGIFTLGLTGPGIAQRLGDGLTSALQAGSGRDPVTISTVGDLFMSSGRSAALALAPVLGACALAAIVISVLQVGIRPKTGALKPDPKRLNPVTGFKNIYGKNSLVELVKNLVKISVVATIVLSAVLPHLGDWAAMVGMSPYQLAGAMAAQVKSIFLRAGLAYLLIGVIDAVYQRFRHEKGMRMDKQEVKEEAKQQDLPPEVRGAIRRRQREAARARMMAAVPEADVIVTNPTHYSVALKYDGASAAPQVIAKGKDIVALRIREIAAEHDIPIVPDPPLARSLHASVEVGEEIPEELFQAVAQILAYVYRVAGRRRLAS
ncbi:flagellar biosynthesis protein FlhB [Baekduia soli]|uniref:Flagellar biosynthetic protein FlhB n=1 Tax=Baekduia soli TaxID=496014 RepID=A0A5B8U1I2_9ACTN|nr:flagellar biosynthesis protein FlhB [Baekduia soli]QEC46863.1 flagellar biosynthesis protein FlhB [Baekduia soli]